MRFGILGPVEVRSASGEPVAVGGPRPRALLALLLLAPGQVQPADRLIDGLYGERPPAGAANALQAQVSRLRRTLRAAGLPDTVLELRPAGYRLAIDPDEVDAHRFARLADAGHRALAAGDHPAAAEALRAALRLWRGPALADVAEAPFAAGQAARLEERRLLAVEDRAEADLALGDQAGPVPELRELLAAHPLREPAIALLVRALAGSGRGAEALTVFEDARRALAAELGADPSPALAAAHLAALRSDPVPVPARGLPAQLTGFVGRERELAGLAESLALARLVTLVGPGGVGKTRLAAEAAARRSGEVCFVELAPVNAEAVPGAVLAALGLREAPLRPGPSGPADLTERLLAALAERSTLLVLDNCEHVIGAAARLADTVLRRCPGVRVLVTSREALGITGEVLRPLAPLPLPPPTATAAESLRYPAVRLFADRAAAVVPGFTVDAENIVAVQRICRALDGLPLAVELAAARLRTLAVAEIADRLDDRFRLLSRGSRTAAPRHQTLRAVVEWSWDLLDAEAQRLARRLAVFAGGASTGAVAAVCGLPDREVAEALAGLVEQSLVEAGGRYRMLETIRAFCLEKLAAAGEEEPLRRAHAEHFLGLARTADPRLRRAEQLDWLARLRAEQDNLWAALRWAVDHDHGLALRLVGALSWYWYLRGLRGQAAGLAARLLDRLGGQPPAGLVEEYALCLLHAGADRPELREPLAALIRQVPAPVRQPYLVVALGTANGPPRRWDTMLPIHREFESGPDPWRRAMTHFSYGYIAWFAGEGIEVAERECGAALATFRELGERWGLAQMLDALATLAAARGDVARSLALTDEALELVARLDAREELADLYCRRADRRLLGGDRTAAEADYRHAAGLARDCGLPAVIALAGCGLGELARLAGDPARALHLHREALRACGEDWADAEARTRIHTALGRDAEATGDLQEALQQHRTALAQALGNRAVPSIGDAADGLAEAVLRTGDPDRAARLRAAATRLRGDPAGPEPAAALDFLAQQVSEVDTDQR